MEYSDLYKFIVSIGVGLISSALVIPWLFLREPFDLHQSEESIAQLTPLAQRIVQERQEYLATIFRFIPWISPCLLVIGLFVVGFGIVMWWYRSQKLVDRRQQLELSEIERAVQPMEQEVVEEKLRAEASEDLEEVTQPEIESFATKAGHIERRVAHILKDCYRDDHKLLSNQRIGYALFDFLLLSKRLPMSRHKNYTIEVKYIRKGFKFGWLRDNIFKVLYLSDIFEKETGIPSFPVLMIVGKGDVLSNIPTHSYFDRIKSEMNSLEANASVVLISESELDKLQCEELIRIIDTGTL